MGMLTGGRNHDDMDRFYDPCGETRTEKQILWEEGIYKEGSLRKLWMESFGKNDISKLGRKIAYLLISMLLWLSADIILDGFVLLPVIKCAVMTFLAFTDMYSLRGKNDFNRLNCGYVIFTAVLSIVFYKAFCYFFEEWGRSIILAMYIFTYSLNGVLALAVRLFATFAVLVYIIRNEVSENIFQKAAAAVFMMQAALGLIYIAAAKYSGLTACKPFLAAGTIIYILSYLLYFMSKSKFILYADTVFLFISVMEILGYTADVQGLLAQ